MLSLQRETDKVAIILSVGLTYKILHPVLNNGNQIRHYWVASNLLITIFKFLLNTPQKYCMSVLSRYASSLLTCLGRASVGSSQIVLQDVFTGWLIFSIFCRSWLCVREQHFLQIIYIPLTVLI